MDLTDPGTTGVAEVIGGVEITTLSKVDNKPTQPLGDPDIQITPLKFLVDSTGGLANKHIIVEVQTVVRAPGRSTVHHLETDDSQTNPEITRSTQRKWHQ